MTEALLYFQEIYSFIQHFKARWSSTKNLWLLDIPEVIKWTQLFEKIDEKNGAIT